MAKPTDARTQTLRATLQIREWLLHGAFKPGERLREVPLAARLGVSRIPLRLVLERLAHEGLLQPRPRGGFVASAFTLSDVHDAIELRGVLEGTAARLAAERLTSGAALQPLRNAVRAIDVLLRHAKPSMSVFEKYVRANEEFHTTLLAQARSPMLDRQMESVLALPFASPSAFIAAETTPTESWPIMVIAQAHHHAIVEAIEQREAGRAEALAREHSRLARRKLESALREHTAWGRVPGASLVTFTKTA